MIIPGSYSLFQFSKVQMLSIMLPATILMIIIDISRLRGWAFWKRIAQKVGGGMIRAHESQGDFTGATYILTATCLTIALFDRPVAVAALAFIIVGDTCAALVGRKFGRHRLGQSFGDKTWEGSLACLAGTVVVALFAPELALPVGIIGATVATLAEAYSFGIDDNVTVPILSGLIMTLAVRWFS